MDTTFGAACMVVAAAAGGVAVARLSARSGLSRL